MRLEWLGKNAFLTIWEKSFSLKSNGGNEFWRGCFQGNLQSRVKIEKETKHFIQTSTMLLWFSPKFSFFTYISVLIFWLADSNMIIIECWTLLWTLLLILRTRNKTLFYVIFFLLSKQVKQWLDIYLKCLRGKKYFFSFFRGMLIIYFCSNCRRYRQKMW